jgi:hypothetical protein
MGQADAPLTPEMRLETHHRKRDHSPAGIGKFGPSETGRGGGAVRNSSET